MQTLYKVLEDSDTFEEFVIYEARYNNPKSKLWVKKKTSFLEEVEINGKKVPRFKFIS